MCVNCDGLLPLPAGIVDRLSPGILVFVVDFTNDRRLRFVVVGDAVPYPGHPGLVRVPVVPDPSNR